jgi:hypothetical protein
MEELNQNLTTSSSSPLILNTPYAGLTTEPTIKDYFQSTPRLGSYSVIQAVLSNGKKVKIVIDQYMPWLQSSINEYFKTEVTKLNLNQIEEYLVHLNKINRIDFSLARFLGLAPHKKLDNNNEIDLFYLDDLTAQKNEKNLIFNLVTQILIERFTTRESRIIRITSITEPESKSEYSVVVQSRDESHYKLFDVLSSFQSLKDHEFKLMNETIENQTTTHLKIAAEDFKVLKPNLAFSERNKTFTIVNGYGQELMFNIIGRTTADKRFKNEEDQFLAAQDQDLVPIEIGFHPFWRRLGHTTIRIGNSLYELSSKGWKAHKSSVDSPRAYLFNNPFFKGQYALYQETGMPPVSIAVTLLAEKHKVAKLNDQLTDMSLAVGKNREKFSLYFNNCNQGIVRALANAGIEGFETNGYMAFSSVLSFRKLLLNPPLERTQLTIYPLPGSNITEENLRRWVPRLVYRYNSVSMEMTRAFPNLAADAFVFLSARVSDLIFKFFKVRLWKGLANYQYINT